MGLLLFRAFLAINAFNIATENPVRAKPYRFPVYPVNECPRSKDEFETAAQRRNCTKGLRYLCAPNKYLSSLIEFCTDRHRGLYQEGNCVILEGTGDLDHYSCVDKFNSTCPLEFYNDEEIYKYPACLEIDREFRCFAADNGCKKREFHTTESHGWPAIGYIIATAAVLTVIILSWIIFQKRKREQVEKCKDNYENESLLNDNTEIDDDELRQFLSKGEITVCHVRCIIVGCGKAGKTTLLKRLQNASFDELMQIERTEMVDFHVNSFEVLLEEETIQSVEKEDILPTILFSKEKLEMPLKENDGKMAKDTHQPASNFVDSGGACNLQMESHEYAEISTNTSIAETDTLQTEQKDDNDARLPEFNPERNNFIFDVSSCFITGSLNCLSASRSYFKGVWDAYQGH